MTTSTRLAVAAMVIVAAGSGFIAGEMHSRRDVIEARRETAMALIKAGTALTSEGEMRVRLALLKRACGEERN